MANMMAETEAIGKFFFQYGFQEIMTSVPQRLLGDMIIGLAMKGNQSRTTDFAELGRHCRTTYGYFLSKGKWDEKKVSEKQQQGEFQVVSQQALERGGADYLSIDDTVVEKKQPSLSKGNPMQWKANHGATLKKCRPKIRKS